MQISHLLFFTPHMPTTGCSQKPRTPSWFPMCVGRSQILLLSVAASQGYQQSSKAQAELSPRHSNLAFPFPSQFTELYSLGKVSKLMSRLSLNKVIFCLTYQRRWIYNFTVENRIKYFSQFVYHNIDSFTRQRTEWLG